MLTETKVYSKIAAKIEGFQVFLAVRSKNCGGGLLEAIRHGICSAVIIEYGDNAEYITIKAALGGKQMRIILAYGLQERSSMQDIEVNRGNSVVLVGDFNES